MHLAGQDAISRATRASGRTLVSLSFVIWFVKFVDAPIGEIVISGVSLPESSSGYGFVQWIVMVPLFVYHVMNWSGDLLSYRGWNDRNKITLSAGFGSATGLMTRLDSVLRTVEEKYGSHPNERVYRNTSLAGDQFSGKTPEFLCGIVYLSLDHISCLVLRNRAVMVVDTREDCQKHSET